MVHDPKPIQVFLARESLGLIRQPPNAPIPAWCTEAEFLIATRSASGISIVCSQSKVPEGVRCEAVLRAFRIESDSKLGNRNELSTILAILAEAQIVCRACSTFSSDIILVDESDLLFSVDALAESGILIAR